MIDSCRTCNARVRVKKDPKDYRNYCKEAPSYDENPGREIFHTSKRPLFCPRDNSENHSSAQSQEGS